MDVINLQKVSENICSSGQPSKAQFSELAGQGVQTVVNLAMSSSDNAIPEEGDIVTRLGMSYVHIPVLWEKPTLEQFELFSAVMDVNEDRKTWVHCALNMRVSAFLYLYNLIHRNEPEDIALKRMHEIWQPNDIWSDFIHRVISAHRL